MNLSIRVAVAGDEGEILRLIRALAVYEREPDAVKATEASIHTALFAPGATVHAFIAEADSRAVGLALWFANYSTWTGTHGIYLEDLYVAGSARGHGVGRALLGRLAREARARGCARIDWAVLDWNVSAQAFYRRMGARALSGWQPWRIEGAALDALAAPAPAGRLP